jgi:UDP-N-acetylglucosamine:LPS N-acetylglucosamine transferase
LSVIFVGGGSLGTNSLPKLLPTILTLKQKTGFIINTGTDKLAFNLIEQFIKILKRLKKNELIQIKHLGWIENMGEVLSASDIVFGKAGPNFLFDVVASQKPFVAMTHIGGQEDGNIDLIRKKKLGWIKEKNGEITDFLYEYLERPKWFEKKYQENIKKEAKKNQGSLKMILDQIKKS